jgi:hypothetical protein
LTLASNGVGSVIGTLFAKYLFDFAVTQHHGGWAAYWWVQAGIIALCLPVLAVFYQGVAVKPASQA